MGANGSYNKDLGRVRGKARTHQEFHHRIGGHKILLQNKNKNQTKLPVNSNSESPIYLLGRVNKKTGCVEVTSMSIYQDHKCVGQIDLKFDKHGNFVPFNGGKGSHYHNLSENGPSRNIGRVSHDKSNSFGIPSQYMPLIQKIVEFNKSGIK